AGAGYPGHASGGAGAAGRHRRHRGDVAGVQHRGDGQGVEWRGLSLSDDAAVVRLSAACRTSVERRKPRAFALPVKRMDQELFARCAGYFISFDERHCARRSAREQRSWPRRGERHGWRESKKRKQRKTLCANGKPGKSSSRGFFYKTSLSCRKTPHVLCGALRVWLRWISVRIFRSRRARAWSLWEILCFPATGQPRLVFGLVPDQREGDAGKLAGQCNQGLDAGQSTREVSLVERFPGVAA